MEKGKEKPLGKGKKKAVEQNKEKPQQKVKEPLGKGITLTPASRGITLTPAPKGKPKRSMVVDWHHTMEAGNRVTSENMVALGKLLDSCQVHILSYVETRWREGQVQRQVRDLLPEELWERLQGVHCTYSRTQKMGSWIGASGWGPQASLMITVISSKSAGELDSCALL